MARFRHLRPQARRDEQRVRQRASIMQSLVVAGVEASILLCMICSSFLEMFVPRNACCVEVRGIASVSVRLRRPLQRVSFFWRVEGSAKGKQPQLSPTPTGTLSIENLIKVAQRIVQGQPQASQQSALPDAPSTSLRVMSVINPVHGTDGSMTGATALVDTGATHPLRKAVSSSEWLASRQVTVNLAGNKQVEMRMTPTGTLLLPISEAGSTTIVPVGELVQALGYRLDWSRSRCRLTAPDGESMRLSMGDGHGCPQLPEYQKRLHSSLD